MNLRLKNQPRKPMSRTRHSRSCLLLLVGLASAATPIGCAPLNIAKHLPWPGRDSESEIPGKMTVVWTDTSLNQSGRPAVRGFEQTGAVAVGSREGALHGAE